MGSLNETNLLTEKLCTNEIEILFSLPTHFKPIHSLLSAYLIIAKKVHLFLTFTFIIETKFILQTSRFLVANDNRYLDHFFFLSTPTVAPPLPVVLVC